VNDTKTEATSQWSLARHRVSIWGTMTDAVTHKPITGVEVTLDKMPAKFEQTLERLARYEGKDWARKVQRPDKTVSREDGLFFFLDLPEGEYELHAVLPRCGGRYGDATQAKKVSSGEPKKNGAGALKDMRVDLVLRPTAIKGRITDAANNAGVGMAEVRVKGSGERAFSDLKGLFMLGPVEATAAERTLQAFAQGYASKEKPGVVVANAGQLLELGDLALAHH